MIKKFRRKPRLNYKPYSKRALVIRRNKFPLYRQPIVGHKNMGKYAYLK